MNKKVPFLYHFGRVLLTPVFKIYYNPVVIGKENLNVSGSMLVAGNHKHFLDQFLTIISTRRGIHYMTKKEYFDDKKVSWFFKGTGCIPVDRSCKDKNCVDLALSVLKDDGAVGLFPEGTRNRTSKLFLLSLEQLVWLRRQIVILFLLLLLGNMVLEVSLLLGMVNLFWLGI